MITQPTRFRTAAYYLGQFHPLEENDRFWGEGFTEWHNVARARSLYPGHRQPKLPGRLGFYDLRCADVISQQIAYAHDVGIDAFCFWHYWFAGKRLLYRPLDTALALNNPHFKFMLGWANETWSGVWHGSPNKVIVEQTYNRNELQAHCHVLSDYISSGSYLSLSGRYPLVIYKPRQIPGGIEYLEEMKRLIYANIGVELYLIGNWSPGRKAEFISPSDYGLDAAVITPVAAHFFNSLAGTAYSGLWQGLRACGIGPEVRPYAQVSSTLEAGVRKVRGISHATIVTGWDNTPRSGRRGLVLSGYNEKTFRRAAKHAMTLEKSRDEPLLFVKSWNEWAEGNTVEPLFNESWSAGAVLKSLLCNDE